MAQNISDQNGRALEYYITDAINKKYKLTLTKTATRDQERDKVKFDNLDSHLKARFQNATSTILDWLDKKFNLHNAKIISLDRLADGASVKGDVTDICITSDGKIINLSIKHNHAAIKHQRPGSLPQQMGLAKTSKPSIDYREEYNLLNLKFVKQAAKDYPNYTLYNEIKADKKNYINKYLYKPICDLAVGFLESHKSKCASNFFSFLVGNLSFYKIIVYPANIKILEYGEIPKPTTYKAKAVNDSHIEIEFSNNWKLNMRLHTASSRIDSESLKFDTQPLNTDVPETIFKYI